MSPVVRKLWACNPSGTMASVGRRFPITGYIKHSEMCPAVRMLWAYNPSGTMRP